MDLLGPVLRDGQRRGEIRTDLDLDELIDFLVEQTYLAAEDVDRSENAARKRFRHFVIPALEARDCSGGEYVSRIREVQHAISTAQDALRNLGLDLRSANVADSWDPPMDGPPPCSRHRCRVATTPIRPH
jgi:hypothetical protein